ncbi:hypothetical protein CIL03_08395 [Virgibacillus indicus]|uniref:Uncharacterized protein n=1 Tax=Virgibacillus indicus TaxID=2024554 RepID=A0A265NB22_9BACI|nr:hypothetical protein [Virgibacillus indicus]OZU89027.1 hypothetical protein CIL03_08395 [Virgibacillus indicus]
MESNWKKRYSFRLTENDLELYNYLEQLPNNKRSETIRSLLKLAYKQIHDGDIQQFHKSLLNELATIKEMQLNVLEKIEKGIVLDKRENGDREDEISERAVADTADAFLASFGVEVD